MSYECIELHTGYPECFHGTMFCIHRLARYNVHVLLMSSSQGMVRYGDINEIGCKSVDWTQLAMDRIEWWILLNTVMSLQVPARTAILLKCWVTVSLSKS